jgi:putative nucleotidyltransferase with HDIG domain
LISPVSCCICFILCWRFQVLRDFMKQIVDLLQRDEVIRMMHYPGHRVHHRSSMQGRTGAVYSRKVRLYHCLRVAYMSYTLAGLLGLDKRVAARSGLLHDTGFDPESRETRAAQIRSHPSRGARIAHQLGESDRVSAAIYSHMFPVNPRSPPATGIALVLWFADKVDAILEMISFSIVLDKILKQYMVNTRRDRDNRLGIENLKQIG